MKRLAGNEDIKNMLNVVEKSISSLNDVYYILLNNLNDLYKEYPNVYEQIQEIVKLPNKDDINDLIDMKNSFEDIKNHFEDDNYLNQFNEEINIDKDENEDIDLSDLIDENSNKEEDNIDEEMDTNDDIENEENSNENDDETEEELDEDLDKAFDEAFEDDDFDEDLDLDESEEEK